MKKRRHQALSVMLTLAMVLSLFPALALPAVAAEDAYTPYGSQSWGKAEGKTAASDPIYFDIYGEDPRRIPAASQATDFYSRVLGASFSDHYGLRRSRADLIWSQISLAAVSANNKARWDYLFSGPAGTTSRLTSTVSGLLPATSIAAATKAIQNLSKDPNGYSFQDNLVPEVLSSWTTGGPVLYETASFTHTADNRFDYVSTIYYDFKLTYLNLEGETPSATTGLSSVEDAQGRRGFTYNTDGSGQKYYALVTNDGSLPAEKSNSLTISKSSTVSSTQESTKGYEHSSTTSIGVEVSMEQEIPFTGTSFSTSVNTNFSSTDTYSSSKTLGKSQSGSETIDQSVQVTVNLPPYTAQMVTQSQDKLSMTIEYDYTVAISYKVMTVYSYAQRNGNEDGMQLVTIFGDATLPDATDNFAARLNLGTSGEALYSNEYPVSGGLENALAYWNEDFPLDPTELMNYRPMSRSGGVLTVTGEGISTTVGEVIALYPLASVKASTNELTLNSGGSFYLSGVALTAKNVIGGEYYGFNPDKGHWIMVGADSTPESADTEVATLYTDPVSGNVKVIAGNKTGTVWMKYIIDEDYYTSGQNPDIYATNASLTSTASFPVYVTGTPVTNVTGVTMSPKTLRLNLGESGQLSAVVAPSGATNKSISYISSDPSVATVDADGQVRGISGGTATITVTTADGGKTDTCAVTVVDNRARMSVGNVGGKAGETVKVPVTVANNPGFSNTKLTLTYDSSVLENPTVVNGISGLSMTANTLTPGQIVLGWNGTSNHTADGTIADISFTIKEGTPNGERPITLAISAGDTTNVNGVAVSFLSGDGGVAVTDYIRGDANGDGYVTMLDATHVARYAVGLISESEINLGAADANKDGRVTMFDATFIARAMVGLETIAP